MNGKVVLVTVLSLAMGFFQERLKIDINFRMQFAPMIAGYDAMTADERAKALTATVPAVPYDYYYSHKSISWFDHFSIGRLSLAKWGLAIALVLIFWVLNIWLLYWGEVPYNYRRLITLGYIIVSALALLTYGVGVWCSFGEAAYLVARRLLGLVQSPLPGIVLYLAHRFYFKPQV